MWWGPACSAPSSLIFVSVFKNEPWILLYLEIPRRCHVFLLSLRAYRDIVKTVDSFVLLQKLLDIAFCHLRRLSSQVYEYSPSISKASASWFLKLLTWNNELTKWIKEFFFTFLCKMARSLVWPKLLCTPHVRFSFSRLYTREIRVCTHFYLKNAYE